ncbi:MAG TPA: universal stress protein [Blastocatellia bacterium]|nr:universal stress protein [Blastocatellia bacterium]
MKILMATDGSDQATAAVRTAGKILNRNNNHDRIDLLCVAPDLSWSKDKVRRPQPGIGQIDQIEEIRDEYQSKIKLEATKIVARTQAMLATEGIEANALTEIGSPTSLIIKMAGDYDLTVIGAHDRYERGKPGLGPVASRVVAQAPGAVLVGRELTTERGWRILIGVDGSLASEQAIQLMVSYFNVDSAEITLMHVVETPWVQLGLEKEWLEPSESFFKRPVAAPSIDHGLWRGASTIIEDSHCQLERLSLSAETIIESGDPALEILSEAERGDYDLIVLGATGDTSLKHSLLGSVSTKVAQSAHCSVFIVKFME